MAAGIAAAGAMVGVTSLASGEEQNTYSQYEKRTEQEDVRDTEVAPKMGIKRQGTADEFFSGAVELPKRSSLGSQKRKTVAIVVSAVVSGSDMDVGDHAVSGPLDVQVFRKLIFSSLLSHISQSTSIPTPHECSF